MIRQCGGLRISAEGIGLGAAGVELHITMFRRTGLTVLLVGIVLVLTGCPPSTSISKITRDPGRYTGKEVTIAGRVTDSYGALGRGMFQVSDGSGTMWVYSDGFGVPSNGLKVAVTGRVQQGFSFGGRSFATILSETKARH